MRIIRTLLIAALMSVGTSASAGLIHDISLCQTDLTSGSKSCNPAGQITLPSESGNSGTDVDFDLNYFTTPYTEANIVAIDWDVGSDWILFFNELVLHADPSCNPTSTTNCQTAALRTNAGSINPGEQQILNGDFTVSNCQVNCETLYMFRGGINSLLFTPVHVPEPTTLTLIGLGVAGLGFRRKAS